MTDILCDWLNREVKLSRTVGESGEVQTGGLRCKEGKRGGFSPRPATGSKWESVSARFLNKVTAA